MASGSTALEADWLGASRRAADALREILDSRPTTDERVQETGTRGEGGDRTLVIDQAAEEAVFAQLEALHDEGHRFTAVSEERGEVPFGDPGVVVVVDPIDGSINAKRGVPAGRQTRTSPIPSRTLAVSSSSVIAPVPRVAYQSAEGPCPLTLPRAPAASRRPRAAGRRDRGGGRGGRAWQATPARRRRARSRRCSRCSRPRRSRPRR